MRLEFQRSPIGTSSNRLEIVEKIKDIEVGYQRSEVKECALRNVQKFAHSRGQRAGLPSLDLLSFPRQTAGGAEKSKLELMNSIEVPAQSNHWFLKVSKAGMEGGVAIVRIAKEVESVCSPQG